MAASCHPHMLAPLTMGLLVPMSKYGVLSHASLVQGGLRCRPNVCLLLFLACSWFFLACRRNPFALVIVQSEVRDGGKRILLCLLKGKHSCELRTGDGRNRGACVDSANVLGM